MDLDQFFLTAIAPVSSFDEIAGVPGPTTATITVIDYTALAGDTLIINGVTYTEPTDFDGVDAGSNNGAAQSIRAALAGDGELSATNNTSPIVVVTRVDGGAIGTVTSGDPINLTVVLS